MTFPNDSSFQSTLEQLKEAVSNTQGDDHESARLIGQIEAILNEIEGKLRHNGTVAGIESVNKSTTPPVITPPSGAIVIA
ncbi:MAG TPA: hypothetical protein V6D17_08540 [Candidatus Obscuribacterales bacterium]